MTILEIRARPFYCRLGWGRSVVSLGRAIRLEAAQLLLCPEFGGGTNARTLEEDRLIPANLEGQELLSDMEATLGTDITCSFKLFIHMCRDQIAVGFYTFLPLLYGSRVECLDPTI